MKKGVFVLIAVGCVFLLATLSWKPSLATVDGDATVASVLLQLGEEEAPHLPNGNTKGASVERGRDIVLFGKTEAPYGGMSNRVSRHFVCTSCHNVERDEPNLAETDPMARLKYVQEKGLPYLQGSALYGIVDRRTFYNGDYEKKYGDLVEAARNDLRGAIHLCATECAQGRALDDWEMESVLSYLWTIGLKMEDLQLTSEEMKDVQAAIAGSGDKTAAVSLLKSKYMEGFPATFIDPPADRKAGFSKIGNPETGQMIYEYSCLHCHDDKRYSQFNLDNSILTFEFLDKHLTTYSRYSLYQVARYGTSPIPGKKAYMPHYTKEKMTEQMLEDLRVYIEQEVK